MKDGCWNPANGKAVAVGEEYVELGTIACELRSIGGYGHDPTAVRSETVKQIVYDLQRQGLNLSDDTVRRFLKEAIDHLSDAKA
jgi:hypothetical protein